MLNALQYRILKAVTPPQHHANPEGNTYAGKSKLRILLGERLLEEIPGKVVIDFGCGEGRQTVELAHAGAQRVIGVDIRESVLNKGRELAAQAGVADRCEFTTKPAVRADLIVSIDSFEHFADPAAILNIMHGQLAPHGKVICSFGPTWYHPLGGHLFSVFPWSHILFSEAALIRWRNDLRNDGATRFSEVEGGLNQLTIARFEKLVAASKFRLDFLETVPIRRLSAVHSSLTREFTSAIVRCRLLPR
jgi:SAM-dependent methyltransferase